MQANIVNMQQNNVPMQPNNLNIPQNNANVQQIVRPVQQIVQPAQQAAQPPKVIDRMKLLKTLLEYKKGLDSTRLIGGGSEEMLTKLRESVDKTIEALRDPKDAITDGEYAGKLKQQAFDDMVEKVKQRPDFKEMIDSVRTPQQLKKLCFDALGSNPEKAMTMRLQKTQVHKTEERERRATLKRRRSTMRRGTVANAARRQTVVNNNANNNANNNLNSLSIRPYRRIPEGAWGRPESPPTVRSKASGL